MRARNGQVPAAAVAWNPSIDQRQQAVSAQVRGTCAVFDNVGLGGGCCHPLLLAQMVDNPWHKPMCLPVGVGGCAQLLLWPTSLQDFRPGGCWPLPLPMVDDPWHKPMRQLGGGGGTVVALDFLGSCPALVHTVEAARPSVSLHS